MLTTPLVGDWNTFPGATPFTSPPFTEDPDTAFSSGFFSRGTIVFQPGSHSITIRDIHIPPSELGPPFADGTVAFQLSAEAIPTLSEWGMIGMVALLAGAGVWALRRRLSAGGTTPRARDSTRQPSIQRPPSARRRILAARG